jgi:predicted  nucleic acid-binding Zn-ribbon protein
MQPNARAVFSHGVRKAVSGRLNLVLAGATATGAVVMQSWALFAASAVGYSALVAWDLTRVGFWKRIVQEIRHRPPALPDTTDLTDPAAKHFVSRIGAARTERREVLSRARDLPPRLMGLLNSVAEAERRALDLVRRLEDVSGYLFDKNVHSLRADLKRVKAAAEQAKDPRTRAEYAKACRALERELEALDEIVRSRNLLVAKLEALTGTIEMLPCQIVRLRVLEADTREEADEEVLDVHQMLAEAEELEQELVRQIEASASRGDEDDVRIEEQEDVRPPIPLRRPRHAAERG